MTGRRKSADGRTFEQTMEKLEKIVEQLEHGNIPLEDSIRMYEEGISLSKECMEKLNQAEKRIKKLGRDLLDDFSPDNGSEGEG